MLPELRGILSAEQVAETAASIASMQEADGAVPWTTGEHTDVWNHVEAAMALMVTGQVDAAERAYAWCLATQREDGSWPMKFVAGVVEDPSGETNMTAYLAVGIWHHWLVRRDVAFVRNAWPTVRRALDWVVAHQLPFGGIAWSQEYVDGRPGGSMRRRCWPARRASTRPCAPGWRSRTWWGAAAGVGAGRRPARPRRCASTATSSSTSPSSRWTGTTRCSGARSAATPAEPCSTAAGTRSSSPGSASAASPPTRG